MGNPEHLKILKQGVEVWNRWREENPDIAPDLSDEVDVLHANLRGINFEKSDLSEGHFDFSDLDGANFRESRSFNTHFNQSDLSNSNFNDATLTGAFFIGSKLEETDFSKCYIRMTTIGLTNLSTCKGLDTVRVGGPCIIDFHTLRASRNLPKSFLLKIGLPENYINYLPDFFDENPIRFYSTFISYSSKNEDFSIKLYNALIGRGVQVYIAKEKMKPGDDIHEGISRGIAVYDKMILICSKESLSSPWVDREISRSLHKEEKLFKERGKKINLLIPIKIDDFVDEWESGKKAEITDRVIGDFRDWQDEVKFQKALDELIAALNVDRGEDAPLSFL